MTMLPVVQLVDTWSELIHILLGVGYMVLPIQLHSLIVRYWWMHTGPGRWSQLWRAVRRMARGRSCLTRREKIVGTLIALVSGFIFFCGVGHLESSQLHPHGGISHYLNAVLTYTAIVAIQLFHADLVDYIGDAVSARDYTRMGRLLKRVGAGWVDWKHPIIHWDRRAAEIHGLEGPATAHYDYWTELVSPIERDKANFNAALMDRGVPYVHTTKHLDGSQVLTVMDRHDGHPAGIVIEVPAVSDPVIGGGPALERFTQIMSVADAALAQSKR